MATYLKPLKSTRGDTILPKTVAIGVFMENKTTVENAVNEKVKKAGDTLTGNMTVNMYGSKQIPVQTYGGDGKVQGVKFGSEGTTVVGGGPLSSLLAKSTFPANDGILYLIGNKGIKLVTDVSQGWDKRKEINVSTDGKLIMGDPNDPNSTGKLDTDISGNADTASKLEKPVTITMQGGANGNIKFDGSGNVTITNTLDMNKATTGILPVARGGTGQNNLDNVVVGKSKALNTARNIALTGGAKGNANFNGSANISIATTLDVSKADAGILPVARGGTGQSSLANITAGTATKLKTARNIKLTGGASGNANFDGSANISIATTLDMSKATAGTLAVARGGTGQTNLANVTVGKASKLATARKIGGVAFDGSADITITPEGIGTNRVKTQESAPASVPAGSLWAW